MVSGGQPVMVPEALRAGVARILESWARSQSLLDGGSTTSREFTRFLLELNGDEIDLGPRRGSANGTEVAEPASVLLTTREIATELDCSERYARSVASRIGHRIGRQWLVDRQAFDRWRST